MGGVGSKEAFVTVAANVAEARPHPTYATRRPHPTDATRLPPRASANPHAADTNAPLKTR